MCGKEILVHKTTCLGVVSLCLWAGSASAQGIYPGANYNPANRPAFSPYLNLLRRDTPLVNNYYGLVRPEINFRNSLQQLDAQQALTSAQQTTLENNLTLPATGHASSFMTQSRYFLNTGAGGGGGGGQFASAQPAPGIQGTQGGAPKGGRR
jgi:hypothetical protein